MVNKIKRVLIGRPMKSTEIEGEKLSKLKALAVLSSDALGRWTRQTDIPEQPARMPTLSLLEGSSASAR